MGNAVFVFGPAGTGKTTFTKRFYEHNLIIGRSVSIFNFDPSQRDEFEGISLDIRDYINTIEVMEELNLGPNGAIMEAFRTIKDNITELELDTYVDNYIIVDCPGQIELYTHSNIMVDILEIFKSQYGYTCSIVFITEAVYLLDFRKFLSGALSGLLCMMKFDVPCIKVMSKLDLVEDFDGNEARLLEEIEIEASKDPFAKNIYSLIELNGMTNFFPLKYDSEESLDNIVYAINSSMDYYSNEETKVNRDYI